MEKPYEVLIVTIGPTEAEVGEDEGDERTVLQSWLEEGTWTNLCMHGADLRDCPRCNPFEVW